MKFNRVFIFFLSLFVALIPFVLPVYYGSDDPRSIYLVTGAYTGEQCTNLVYNGVIFGETVAWLYRLHEGVEWYSVVIYTLYLFAFLTIIWNLTCSNIQIKIKYLLLFLTTLVQIHLSLSPQYTLLASDLAFASFIDLININTNKNNAILAIILFLSELRFQASYIPYIIGSPLLIYFFKTEKQLRKSFSLTFVGLIIVATASYTASHTGYYKSEKWKDFREYNEARQNLADNRFAQFHAITLHDAEDSIAYELFYRYRLFDKDILTKSKLQSYDRYYAKHTLDCISFNKNEYIDYFSNNGLYIIFFVVFISLASLLFQKKRVETIIIIGTWTIFGLCVAYMASTSFPKQRVLLCSMVTVLFVTLYSIRESKTLYKILCLISCIYFAYFYTIKIYEDYIRTTSPHNDVTEVESLLGRHHGGRVMLPVPTALTPEAFHTSTSPIGKKGIIQGWLNVYPESKEEYQRFTTFTDKDIPLLTKKTATEQIGLVQKLLYMHYGQRTKVDTLDQSENYVLLRIRKDNHR